MSAPTQAPFTTTVRGESTLLLLDDLVAAAVSTCPTAGQWLASLWEPGRLDDDHAQVWCESLEAATKLAEFHARMCARLVAAGVRA